MTKESGNHQYVNYPMFKGLQKPLEFMGFQGRYITWAATTVGGGIGAALIFFKQRKGLHTKKEEHGIFIYAHTHKL